MALSAALPLNLGILWRAFDRYRASPEGIESASGASSSALCFPQRLGNPKVNKHCIFKKRVTNDS
jgi:hypothetical protein